MRYLLFFSTLAVIAANTFAQDAPAGKTSRDAVIRSALARDHGDITAMEASRRDGGGVFIGYSSGAVVNCRGEKGCKTLDGTPSSAVTGAVLTLSISLSAGVEVIWVAYPHGVVYRCREFSCREFDATKANGG